MRIIMHTLNYASVLTISTKLQTEQNLAIISGFLDVLNVASQVTIYYDRAKER